MIKSAKLISNDDNHVIATYEAENYYELSTSGKVFEAVSWSGDDGIPYESSFFAYVNVKWDGCSHIYFYGEGAEKGDKEDRDSYYHLCGVGSYLNFMRMLVFAYEIMVEHVGYENVLEKAEYEDLKRLNLLDGYRIEYVTK